MEQAQKILSEIDRPRKVYRLTYSITEVEGDKRIGTEHFALVVVAEGKTVLKQGSRVPIVTGAHSTGSAKGDTEVEYVDLGLTIEASLDGERLHTKVEQSSLGEMKSLGGTQDPMIRQTVLDGMSNLVNDKAIVLGSLDIPDSTRHREIEVASELVQ